NKLMASVDLKNWANLSRSVLNGIVGDYLEKEHNPLAIDMAFYQQNIPLLLDDTLAQQVLQGSGSVKAEKALSNKIIVLIHGLTNLETIWDLKPDSLGGESEGESSSNGRSSDDDEALSEKDNYGRRLQEEFGFTPFYLRYNTGLSIKDNGQKLTRLLSELIEAYPIPVEEIVLMGFSMGGLLIRSAQKLAQDAEADWLSLLSNCYYIGTPHEGSPLEKFGHLTSSIVRYIPRDYISHWADWIDVRSQGIQDLKDGLLHLNKEKRGADSDDPYEQSVRCGSFTAHAQHHFISGSLSANKNSLLNKYFGDSLVRHTSANPISAPEDSKQAHFNGIPHVPLAHSEKVYQQINQWFREHPDHIDLKFYEVREATKKQQMVQRVAQGLSNQEIISGSLDLLALAYDHTVDAVEKVHGAIADEPYSVLRKVPLIKDVTLPIEDSHKDILNTIYFSLKAGGKLAHKGAKVLGGKHSKENESEDK
ncbi:triacylglycerol lipase, partial [Oleiphilus sp. HI0117]